MTLPIKTAPSILSADFVNLERDIRALGPAGADYVHVDVMDGHFVPNITIGIPVVAAIKKISPLPLDVHLMIAAPPWRRPGPWGSRPPFPSSPTPGPRRCCPIWSSAI